MSEPQVHRAPPTPRRGKRIMWLLGLVVLLSIGYAAWMMSERPPERPNPGMSEAQTGVAR